MSEFTPLTHTKKGVLHGYPNRNAGSLSQLLLARSETGESLSAEQIDARAWELLAQLTLDEKVDLMSADPPFWSGLADMFSGGYNAHVWPAGATATAGDSRHPL